MNINHNMLITYIGIFMHVYIYREAYKETWQASMQISLLSCHQPSRAHDAAAGSFSQVALH